MAVQLGRTWQLEAWREVAGQATLVRSWGPPQQMTCEVEQGVTRGMDRLKLTLVNLSPDSVGFLTRDNMKLRLRAGYEGSDGLIFSGQISRRGVRSAVVTTKSGTDRITTIEAGTGEVSLQTIRFDRSYGRNTSSSAIIDDAALALGVSVRDRAVIPEINYLTGWAHSGLASQALDLLAGDLQTAWSLQGETLIMMPEDVFSPETVALISRDTGLIGRVVVNVNGIEFTTLLNPTLRPGRGAVINAIGVKDGRYRIDKVKHTADFRGGTWFSSCFSRYLGGQS